MPALGIWITVLCGLINRGLAEPAGDAVWEITLAGGEIILADVFTPIWLITGRTGPTEEG